METVKQIWENIKQETLIDKIKIIINICYFFLIRTFFSYDKVAKFYYKKVLYSCTMKKKKIHYFFQLNSFLEIYEDYSFLDTIFKDTSQVFIDIGANIGRISSLASTYGTFQKIFALDANPMCTNFMKHFIPHTIREKIEILDYGIGDYTKTTTMLITSDVMSPCGTLCKEKSALGDAKQTMEIKVKILSFKDFFLESKLYIYITYLLKIDVEGFEKEILTSLLDFAFEHKRKYLFKVIVEILPQNYNEIIKILKDSHITITKLGNGHDYFFTI